MSKRSLARRAPSLSDSFSSASSARKASTAPAHVPFAGSSPAATDATAGTTSGGGASTAAGGASRFGGPSIGRHSGSAARGVSSGGGAHDRSRTSHTAKQ